MGGEWTPISKPWRIPIGTSENLLKGTVLLRNFSHWSGMNGVFMVSKSRDGVALLSVMGKRTAEGTAMLAPNAGVLAFGTARGAVPRITVPPSGFALAYPGRFLSDEMAGSPVRATRCCAIAR